MKQFIDLANDILENGVVRGDRTGTGTKSVFGRQLRFDLSEGFPLLTTRKMFLRGIIHELLWFLKGSTDNNELTKHNVHIWDKWATEDGDLGPVYSEQWRAWKGKVLGFEDASIDADSGYLVNSVVTGNPIRQKHDQIAELIHNLKTKPFSRRHVISAWNVEDLPDESMSPQENVKAGKMALAPCHCLFQFYVEPLHISGIPVYKEGTNEPVLKLSCQLYQRSADFLVGSSFNIPSYALLTMMIAQCVDMVPGDFVYSLGDTHIYLDQIDIYKEQQMDRTPLKLPTLWINPEKKDIFSFTIDDFVLQDYESHGRVDYPISV